MWSAAYQQVGRDGMLKTHTHTQRVFLSGNNKVQWNASYALGSLFAQPGVWELAGGQLQAAVDALRALLAAPDTPDKVAAHAGEALRWCP